MFRKAATAYQPIVPTHTGWGTVICVAVGLMNTGIAL